MQRAPVMNSNLALPDAQTSRKRGRSFHSCVIHSTGRPVRSPCCIYRGQFVRKDIVFQAVQWGRFEVAARARPPSFPRVSQARFGMASPAVPTHALNVHRERFGPEAPAFTQPVFWTTALGCERL